MTTPTEYNHILKKFPKVYEASRRRVLGKFADTPVHELMQKSEEAYEQAYLVKHKLERRSQELEALLAEVSKKQAELDAIASEVTDAVAIDELIEIKIDQMRKIYKSVPASIRLDPATLVLIEDECGENHAFGKDAVYLNRHYPRPQWDTPVDYYPVDRSVTENLERLESVGAITVHFVANEKYAEYMETQQPAYSEAYEQVQAQREESYLTSLEEFSPMDIPELTALHKTLSRNIIKYLKTEDCNSIERGILEGQQKAIEELIERKDIETARIGYESLPEQYKSDPFTYIVCKSQLGNKYLFGETIERFAPSSPASEYYKVTEEDIDYMKDEIQEYNIMSLIQVPFSPTTEKSKVESRSQHK